MNFGFKSVSKLPDFPRDIPFGPGEARQTVGWAIKANLSIPVSFSLALWESGTKPYRISRGIGIEWPLTLELPKI